jgi:maltooligosyltrehalose synthase
MTKEQHPRIPSCTYRLQFNRWFTFSQAREIVPYLDALGISDVYASPYFQASPDSLHGYDITDHNKLNGAIGSREDYEAWVGELHAHAMGQILDFVPNHVGIAEPLNEWWMDVLENGPSSRYAPYFDIDWQPLKSDLRDKVLLPILSDQYGRVLERGELQVRFEEGTFYLLYGERRLPIAPGTYRYVLETRNCKAFLLRSNICQNAPKPIQNASLSAFVKRRSSSGVWNAVARKRHKSNRQLKRRLSRSMGSPATRAALMRWINYSTRSLIGWRFGESLQRKLITVVFLM